MTTKRFTSARPAGLATTGVPTDTADKDIHLTKITGDLDGFRVRVRQSSREDYGGGEADAAGGTSGTGSTDSTDSTDTAHVMHGGH